MQVTRTCKKCGSELNTVKYVYDMSGATNRDWLRVKCNACDYLWTENCLDAKPLDKRQKE